MIPKNCHEVTFHLIIVLITTFISSAICNLLFASRMCPLFQMERWLVSTGAQTKIQLSLFFLLHSSITSPTQNCFAGDEVENVLQCVTK